MAKTFRISKIEQLIKRLEIRKQCAEEYHERELSLLDVKLNLPNSAQYWEGQINVTNSVIKDIQEIFGNSKAQ